MAVFFIEILKQEPNCEKQGNRSSRRSRNEALVHRSVLDVSGTDYRQNPDLLHTVLSRPFCRVAIRAVETSEGIAQGAGYPQHARLRVHPRGGAGALHDRRGVPIDPGCKGE